MIKAPLFIPGHGDVDIEITQPDPKDDGLLKLVASWRATACSLLPCPRSIERWPDGGWRVFGEREPHPTALAAAIDFLRKPGLDTQVPGA